MRLSEDDDSNSSDGRTAFSTAPSELLQALVGSDESAISAIVEHHTGEYIFCAKENGSVAVYETAHARPKQKLLDYGRAEVLFMTWNAARNLLACADTSSGVRVHQVVLKQERRAMGATKVIWHCSTILKRSLPQPVRQILLSLDGEYLLVCTATEEYIYRTSGGAPLVNDCSALSSGMEQAQRWATFSRNKYRIYDVYSGSRIISWDRDGSNLQVETLKPSERISTHISKPRGNAYLISIGENMWAANDSNQHTTPVIWPQSTAPLPEAAAAKITAYGLREFDKIAAQIRTIIGLYHFRLVFVSIEQWVCSVRIDRPKFDEPVVNHFPIPHSWRRSNRPLRCLMTMNGDIVFAVDVDLVVVRHSIEELQMSSIKHGVRS